MTLPDSIWAPCDPLGEALQQMHVEGLFYCSSHLTAPWGAQMPAFEGAMMFHVVLSGRCWLQCPGQEPFALEPGDLVLFSRGQGHQVMSAPGVQVVDLFALERVERSERHEVIAYGGGGQKTTMICGAIRLESPATGPFLQQMPPWIHVDSWEPVEAEWMQSTLSLLAYETQSMRPGGDALLTRLCDALVIQALRWWLQRGEHGQQGWLAGVQDPRIGRAMGLIHRAPEEDWDVASLARAAAMSRSGFAAHFSRLVGETPMRYLTRWRMQLAWQELRRDPDASIGQLARRFGYRSEAAFRRAFKRALGVPPGAARRAQGYMASGPRQA